MIKLLVEILDEEITISTVDDIEVVKWIHTEWEEDPTVTIAIASSIDMAHTDPEKLIRMVVTPARQKLIFKTNKSELKDE